MKKGLSIASLLPLIIGFILWGVGGFRKGWTQTEIPVEKTDPITEITYIEYQSGFVPGLEVLMAGVGITVFALILVRLLIKK